VREGLVFEVADAEFDDGVLAVLSLDEAERAGAVGREREVLQDGNSSPCWLEGVRLTV